MPYFQHSLSSDVEELFPEEMRTNVTEGEQLKREPVWVEGTPSQTITSTWLCGSRGAHAKIEKKSKAQLLSSGSTDVGFR